MYSELTSRQIKELKRFVDAKLYNSMAEAKRAAVTDGIRVLQEKNGMKPLPIGE